MYGMCKKKKSLQCITQWERIIAGEKFTAVLSGKERSFDCVNYILCFFDGLH